MLCTSSHDHAHHASSGFVYAYLGGHVLLRTACDWCVGADGPKRPRCSGQSRAEVILKGAGIPLPLDRAESSWFTVLNDEVKHQISISRIPGTLMQPAWGCWTRWRRSATC
jgi:hypothetical protein